MVANRESNKESLPSHFSRRRTIVVIVAIVVVGSAAFAVQNTRTKHRREEALRTEYLSYEGADTRAIEPNLAVSSRGEVVVAWMRSPAHSERERDEPSKREPARDEHDGAEEAADALGVRFSADNGRHFGPIQLVRSNGRFLADPAIAVLSSGAFVLTWLAFRADVVNHGDAYDMRVYAARAEPGSGHFDEATSSRRTRAIANTTGRGRPSR